MRKIDLTKGSILKALLALALPIMGSSLLQFTYNLVDMLWIGHLGSKHVASIGTASFFVNLGNALSMLVIMGVGIKVAHRIGDQDPLGAESYMHIGIKLTTLLGILYAALLILFGKQLIGFFNLKDQSILEEGYLYLAWSGPILIFTFLNSLFSRYFASLGNSMSALKISSVGIGINILLDPLLIYGLKWGVVGAAIATLIAQVVMFFLYLYVSKGNLSWRRDEPIKWQQVKEITRLGLPVALQRVSFTLINILLARMIAIYGADAVAAQKIGAQIEAVTYMITGGLNGAVASYIGQNYGAKKKDRLRKGYKIALAIGGGYAFLCMGLFLLFSEQLVRLFVSEIGTIQIAISYLTIIAYSQVFNAIEMVSTGFFTGIGQTKIPSIVSILFTALRLPLAYVFMGSLGVSGIWWSIAISTILKGMILLSIYVIKTKRFYHRAA